MGEVYKNLKLQGDDGGAQSHGFAHEHHGESTLEVLSKSDQL